MLWLLACAQPDGSDHDWAVSPVDLGAPVVEVGEFDPGDGEALGAAFAELLPGLGDGHPTWDVPQALWALAMDDLVADEGSCPAKELQGDATVFRGDCRSRDGYAWTGNVTVTSEGDEERYDFEVDVVADVDDAAFDRLGLHGSAVRVRRDDVEHVDSNLSAELVGYFERRGESNNPRVTTWANWAASGSVEVDGSALRVALAGRAGASGDFGLDGTLTLDEGCPTEPTGTAALGAGAVATFEGVEACDACATVSGEDGEVLACAP